MTRMDYKFLLRIFTIFIVLLIGLLLHECTHMDVFLYGCPGSHPYSAYDGFAVKLDDMSTCQNWVMLAQTQVDMIGYGVEMPLSVIIILMVLKIIDDDK